MGMEGGGIMAKLVFEQGPVDIPFSAKGEKYTYDLHSRMLFLYQKGSMSSHDIYINSDDKPNMEENKNRCQFIEDNYPTLTLEQLDNIEEVYLRSKEK